VLRIQFAQTAKSDLDELRDYLMPLNPVAFQNVARAISGKIRLVAEHPGSGRQSPRDDVREAIETRYGFLIPYMVRGDTLYVLRVYRGVRKPLDYAALLIE
jgi:toxin ParE1/3/4